MRGGLSTHLGELSNLSCHATRHSQVVLLAFVRAEEESRQRPGTGAACGGGDASFPCPAEVRCPAGIGLSSDLCGCADSPLTYGVWLTLFTHLRCHRTQFHFCVDRGGVIFSNG